MPRPGGAARPGFRFPRLLRSDTAAMPMVRCPTPADAAEAIERLRATREAGVFLFFGSEDPQSAESWCPDCVTADPVLRAAIRRLRPDLTVYECPVGERAQW